MGDRPLEQGSVLDLLHLTQNPTDTVALKQEPSSHVDGNDYSMITTLKKLRKV